MHLQDINIIGEQFKSGLKEASPRTLSKRHFENARID